MCRRQRPTDPALFTCISLLSRAVGDALYADMKVSLENMLAGSLTPALTDCLQIMAQEIPNLRKDVQGMAISLLLGAFWLSIWSVILWTKKEYWYSEATTIAKWLALAEA